MINLQKSRLLNTIFCLVAIMLLTTLPARSDEDEVYFQTNSEESENDGNKDALTELPDRSDDDEVYLKPKSCKSFPQKGLLKL